MPHSQQRRGFTLIELLLTIGIIGVIASITLVALNPLRAFTGAHDARRKNFEKQLTNAVYQQLIQEWAIQSAITAIPKDVCRKGIANNPSCVNVEGLVTAGYISDIDVDPWEACFFKTGYQISFDGSRPRTTALYLGLPEKPAPPQGYCDPCEPDQVSVAALIAENQSGCTSNADCQKFFPVAECSSPFRYCCGLALRAGASFANAVQTAINNFDTPCVPDGGLCFLCACAPSTAVCSAGTCVLQ